MTPISAARAISRLAWQGTRTILDSNVSVNAGFVAYDPSSAGCISLRAASVRLPDKDGYTANVCAT
jgi:hypothetical protein